MRMFALSDDKDSLTGLRLAGIEGRLVKGKKELEGAVSEALADPRLAVLLISEGIAALIPKTVKELKLSAKTPLLVLIPDKSGKGRESDAIAGLVREAIGIKI